MADDVNVKMGADVSGLSGAVAQVKGHFNELTGAGDKLAANFGKIGSAATTLFAGLAVVGLDSFVRGMAQSGAEAEKLSAALGITGSQFSSLKAVAALTDTPIETLAMSIERLSLMVQRSTREAFTPQAAALRVIGLSAKELIGLPADQFFMKIADAASHYNTSLNLTNALQQLGVRNVNALMASFTRGKDEIAAFTAELARTKVGQEGFYSAAADTHRQLILMDSAVEGLNKQLFIALKPTIDIIIIRTREFAIAVRESIRDGGAWSVVLDTLSASLKGVVNILQLGALVINSFIIIVTNLTKFIFSFDYSLENLRQTSKKLSDELGKELTTSLKKVGDTWRQVSEETKNKPIGLDAAAIDLEGRKAFEMTLKAIDGQIALLETSLERKKILYDKDLMNLGITEVQKINLVSQATQQKYAAEIAFLQQKLQVAGMDVAQQQDIQNQITLLTQKALNDRLRMQNEVAHEIQSQWGSMLNTIQSSFAGQLRGLLQGTTTWKNAMKSIFTDIVVFAIQKFTELAIIKPMIKALSDAFAPTEIFADILKIISKMIGQVFAGATAFFAPTLGPAAPAAGAAVAATTEAAAVAYDTGAWSVPQTANALVHRDEMILPVDFASAVRSALTGGAMGGSSNMNVNIQAWDGASVARWLRTGGADVMARAISAQYNQNPTVRPRY